VTVGEAWARAPVTVIVGVDGSGRTRRLEAAGVVAGGELVRIGVGSRPGPALDALLTLAAAGATVLVDDAHRLELGVLRALLDEVRSGTVIVMARRPSIGSAELADLDAELAARGEVESLGPLDLDGVAALLGPETADRAEEVLAASCGLAAVASCLAAATPGSPVPALAARVQRQLIPLDPAAVAVAHVLALRLDLSDDVVAVTAGVDRDQLAAAARALREAGLLDPTGEAMVPAVADVIRADLSPAELRRTYDQLAATLLAEGRDVVPIAARMRAARVRTASAAGIYRAAGEQLRFADPTESVQWLDDALDAGVDPQQVALARAEAGTLLGLAVDVDLIVAPGADAERLRRVEGVAAAQQGRAARAADLLLAGGPLGRLLAVPSLIAVGRRDEALECAVGAGPVGLRLTAEAAVACTDPEAAVPLFIEAAEAFEANRPESVLVDTPHGLAAPVAVLSGDAATAEMLLLRAIGSGAGGPAAAPRHRLLLAWVRLRAGRFDTAVAELAGGAPSAVNGRDRLLVAALEAGLARRSGDIARLRSAWAHAEHVLARRAVDLFHVEPLEELLVAATRLRQAKRLEPVLAALDAALDGLGRPAAWQVALGWARLQIAIAGEDDPAAAEEAARLARLEPGGFRQQAQCEAAAQWARVLIGDVDADAIGEVLDQLAGVQLPWEASRLAGQAAIRVTDPGVARRLLERARELSSSEVQLDETRAVAPTGGLSEREIEVAQLVVAGRTHREIGGQLFLSPKTVEHHVARIRTKLGATTRAEFLAALRTVLGSESAPHG
jgi:DNA-binding CsgD family transcriptional regulator